MCKLLGKGPAWISTIHHPYDNAYAGAPLLPIFAPMWKLADGIIAVSEPVREWAIRRIGISPSRVQTIVHGINLDLIKDNARPATRMSDDRYSIGSIGRYEERKGHGTLILAMPTILKRFPSAQLKIAGHDPWGYGGVLKTMIRDLGLEDRVHLVGFMSNKEQFFDDIDVFAFASKSEGFGIVVLEAMHAGVPAVVSNISPLNQIIVPDESGLVADNENPDSFAHAIISLLENREHLRRIGEAGRARVAAEFSVERMVERTIGYYRQVIDGRGRAKTERALV
jgi:glycosyltransferase involved in cell wall biosynthesis